MVLDRQHGYDPQQAAICSIAQRIGWSHEALRNRVGGPSGTPVSGRG